MSLCSENSLAILLDGVRRQPLGSVFAQLRDI